MAIWPPGFGFRPSDKELVNHYLYRKIYGCLPLEGNEQDSLVIPDHFIIPEVYIYDHDPRELQKLFRELSLAQLDTGECYFFCLPRNKYHRGHEENRTAKSGYWKSRGPKQTITTSKMTAEKTGLTFYQGQQRNGIVTEYMMHQYRPISNNIYPNITPQEMMPYDLCYIFIKKTKQDQGDSAPTCNGGDSSITINGTTNGYTSQIESDHQGDQTIEFEETYSSQPPTNYDRNEIYPMQQYYDVDRELAFPSTAYAYARSYNSQIPGDQQVDQTMEFEETYSSQPPKYYDRNEIYPMQQYYDVDKELAFPSTAYAYARSYNSQIPGDQQVDQTMEFEETYSSQPPTYYDRNEIYPMQQYYDVDKELAFPSTAYGYAGSYNSQNPGDHQVDQTIEFEETNSSQPPMYYDRNEIYPMQQYYDVDRELALPSTAYAYARSYNSQIPGDQQVDQTMEFEETNSSQPPTCYDRNEIYPMQQYYDVDKELAFPSTAYAYAGSYNSQNPGDHQVDQTIEFEETNSSQPPMYYDRNEIYPMQQYYDVDRELALPSTAYAYARSYNSQIPGDHQVDQPMELEEIYNSLPQPDANFNMIYPPSAYI